jgi:Ca-activated chloride channel family protein
VSFDYPVALLALAFVPLSALIYAAAQRRRRRFAVRFTNMDLLADVVTETPSWRRHIPPALFLLALAALAIAIARPHELVSVAKREATVVLATDSSGSMQATDVSPSRLSAAKHAASTFADDTPGQVKLGFISFNSTSQLLVPPTSDKGRVKAAIGSLQPGGGTAIGSAIQTALVALKPTIDENAKKNRASGKGKGKAPPAVIVLLSDGKNTTGLPPGRGAQLAKEQNVPVYTVALGTQNAVVQVADPVGGFRTVRVPPDHNALRQIADTTGGKFFATADSQKLNAIYKGLGSRIGFRKERRELTAAFAAGGLALMMLGGAFSLMWFGRLP